MTPERIIINNLKQQTHGISGVAAITGIDDLSFGFRALTTLVDNDIVTSEVIEFEHYALVKYRYNALRLLTTPKLTLVKTHE